MGADTAAEAGAMVAALTTRTTITRVGGVRPPAVPMDSRVPMGSRVAPTDGRAMDRLPSVSGPFVSPPAGTVPGARHRPTRRVAAIFPVSASSGGPSRADRATNPTFSVHILAAV